MQRRLALSLMLIVALIAGGRSTPAAAQEVKEIAIAQQFGAIFIPLMAMENLQLVEKQATARGIGDVKVTWAKLAGPSVMVDAILSGNLHFSAQGVPSLALMWDRTRLASAYVPSPRSPIRTSISTRQSKHQVDPGFQREGPHRRSVGEGIDAGTVLQIAAEKEWGPGQHTRLDYMTVGLAHPDAIAAVLNPVGEVTAHFATSPFHEAEMKAGLKTVTSGYQIMGGEVSNLVF